MRTTLEWVGIVVGALVVALIVKSFLFQPFFIPSESMVPTLRVHDRLLVNKVSYKLHDVHRGDIVVFERPPSEAVGPTNKDLIKRVVGLGGDTVEGRAGHVVVNGKDLKEPYLPKGTFTSDFGPVTVAKGSIWVMGDNRPNSRDSRFFGTIDQDLIVGRAFVRFWPVTDLSLL
jgi:signal peptidase I